MAIGAFDTDAPSAILVLAGAGLVAGALGLALTQGTVNI